MPMTFPGSLRSPSRRLAAGAIALVLAACGGASGPGDTGPSVQDKSFATSWVSVDGSTSCEALVPSACAGVYGFSVSRAGHAVAGPGPGGKTVEADLSAAELSQWQADADALALDIAGDPVGTCQSVGQTVPGSGDRVGMVVSAGQPGKPVRKTELLAIQTCRYGGDALASSRVLDDFDRLRRKYYPSTF